MDNLNSLGEINSQRVKKINHNGKEIIYIDFSNSGPELLIKTMDESAPIIRSCPPKSALTLVDVKNVKFNSDVTEKNKTYIKDNSPHENKTAVIGLGGLMRTMFPLIGRMTGRIDTMKAFNNVEEAKDWLVK